VPCPRNRPAPILGPGFRIGFDGRTDRDARGAGRSKVIQEVRNPVELLRADNQVHVRQMLEKLSPPILGHASEDSQNEIGTAPLLGQRVACLANRLLLGRVANTAGIEQEDIARLLPIHNPVPAGTKERRDRLAVAFVHLAAVGLDMDAVHPREGTD